MTSRAIVFDLDETLYRERRFALSGYRSIAGLIERDFGVSRQAAFRFLALCLRRGHRARAFQALAAHFGLPETSVLAWIAAYRAHEPRLRLRPDVRGALERLRGQWRVGILTNGLPSVQAAKVKALGLNGLVDAVTFADPFDGGKPAPAAFLDILARLGAAPERTVFAGDDPERDIAGAQRVGMKTVLVDRSGDGWTRGGPRADAVVRLVSDVPAVADRLVSGGSNHVH
jgi:putative hydrolase of the HAD superfamily